MYERTVHKVYHLDCMRKYVTGPEPIRDDVCCFTINFGDKNKRVHQALERESELELWTNLCSEHISVCLLVDVLGIVLRSLDMSYGEN